MFSYITSDLISERLTLAAEGGKMLHIVGAGFLMILVAGVVQGTVLMPMPYLKKWPWQNIWLLYSSFAYLLLPWPFALFTIPHLMTVLGSTSHEVIVRTLLMGFLWGLAVVLFGVGVDMLGLALGTAIIMGLGTSVGSLVPLIGQHREQLWAPSGICTLAGVVLLTIAVVLFSTAGKKREQILKARSGQAPVDSGLVRSGRFLAGLIVCILCGFLNPLINIAFAYGSEIQRQAVKYGATANFRGQRRVALGGERRILPQSHLLVVSAEKESDLEHLPRRDGQILAAPARDGPDVDLRHRYVWRRGQRHGFSGTSHRLARFFVHHGPRRQ